MKKLNKKVYSCIFIFCDGKTPCESLIHWEMKAVFLYVEMYSVIYNNRYMKYSINKGSHAVYCIQFHYICCIKYRKEVLTKEVSDRLKSINLDVAKRFGVEIIEQETSKDHIHILFASKPQIQESKFINSIKSVSSRLTKKEFPEIKNQLWKDAFWSRSYFLASTGQVTLDVLKNYVQNQEK